MLNQTSKYFVQVGSNVEFAQRWASLHGMKTRGETVTLPCGKKGLELDTSDNDDLSITIGTDKRAHLVLKERKRAIGTVVLDEKALKTTRMTTYVITPLLAAMQ